jgi:hypothetical protein
MTLQFLEILVVVVRANAKKVRSLLETARIVTRRDGGAYPCCDGETSSTDEVTCVSHADAFARLF